MNLTHIFELETSLIPLMLEMRSRGVRVDLDKAERQKRLAKREKGNQNEIKHKTGILVEPWVATSVASVLGHYGIDCPKTENSKQPSITKGVLASMST
jgi:hypothetical protein